MFNLSYLSRCAHLADLGDGRVLDNPRVGAVLVHRGRIIGEGYHRQAGTAHAEVNCLRSVRSLDRPLIKQSTLYISLEPCYVTGRTGACVDVIKREGIPRVVFAQRDTTEGAGGHSTELLRAAGVEVIEYPDFAPTLAPNAHRRVLTLQQRPYVILKWAQSADGFLRPEDRKADYWITNPISRRLVHRWRAQTSAIVVGARTVIEDNPSLTTRLFPGPDPRRVVIDLRHRCEGREKIFTDGGEIPLLFAAEERPGFPAEVIVLPTSELAAALPLVLQALYERRYGQITVEGGATVLQAFLDTNTWEEARVFTGAKALGIGLSAPIRASKPTTTRTIGTDYLQSWRNPSTLI
ncbi:MAG: bifunctional diaminohydroxyphosphoribosylaminopyrimidine deaminase/5-amino-6-(5-phosphoribosylamino)uracil reductase RibD [Bacteroidota bacterium]